MDGCGTENIRVLKQEKNNLDKDLSMAIKLNMNCIIALCGENKYYSIFFHLIDD